LIGTLECNDHIDIRMWNYRTEADCSHFCGIRYAGASMADEYAIHCATLAQLLEQVPGVQHVQLDRDAAGVLHDLCIEVAPRSNVRHIIKDIRSILVAHRQPGQPDPAICLISATLAPATDLRIQLRELIHTRGQPIVTVSLALQGRRVVGIGRSDENTTASLEFLAGDATVRAINRLITPMTQLHLDHIQRTQIGQLDLCLAQLTVVVDRDQQTAIGVSRIHSDGAEAAARAVLDATNRHLARLVAIPF
jgi:hypothetical protein